jgi:hypothetical protein
MDAALADGAEAKLMRLPCGAPTTSAPCSRPWAGRVDDVVDGGEELDVPAVLLRSDGHVARGGGDRQELLGRRSRWVGAAA